MNVQKYDSPSVPLLVLVVMGSKTWKHVTGKEVQDDSCPMFY